MKKIYFNDYLGLSPRVCSEQRERDFFRDKYYKRYDKV